MEPSLSSILVIVGLVYLIFGIIVGSDAQNAVNLRPPPPPPPPPPGSQPPPGGTPLLPASHPPSPPQVPRCPPPSSNIFRNKPSDGTTRRRSPASGRPPPKREHKLNAGEKIGLLFSGIAAILQIGAVGLLVFKRRQLLKINERYETNSS